MLERVSVELRQRDEGAAVDAEYVLEEIAILLRLGLLLKYVALRGRLLASGNLDVQGLLKVSL